MGRTRTMLSAALLLVLSVPSGAQQRAALTLDDIYHPDRALNFSGSSMRLAWIDDRRYAVAESTPGGTAWTAVDAVNGAALPLFDPAQMERALGGLSISEEERRRAARTAALTFDAAYSAALLPIGGDLYYYNFEANRATRLTTAPGDEELPAFSPDGRQVAFVRHNDLFAVEVATSREIRLTDDGAARIFNGKLDWVYEEEIYGRGEQRAFWWSPDSTRIAFLRLDDTRLPVFTIVDDIPYEQVVERWDYPRAGDPNPEATLGVAAIDGTPVSWVETSRYPVADRLIVKVGWSRDATRVVFSVQNRTQTWLDLNAAEPGSGRARTLLREATQPFIDPGNTDIPTWLADGSFLWFSERSGWKHLYHHAADGALLRQITDGRWEARALHGIDEPAGWIYFSGTERSVTGGDVYRIRLDGSRLTRLTHTPGTHSARFSPGFSYFADTWSDVTTPPQTRLHRNDGGELRTLNANRVAALERLALRAPEFVQVPARDGFLMEAMMFKPPRFDPSRRYPVYQFTYGGPTSQRVLNAWRGTEYLFHQMLAQQGIIVWICDNRSASGKGAQAVWPIHKNLGALELRDIEDGVAWLKRQPYVDGQRIGLHGWSYGGYLTSYALTHSTSFAMGISGGTVADWRDYDSVYTERYMGLPSENAEGYRRSSPRFAAANLEAPFMLIHGAIDDNVHLANAMQFAYELQRADKRFELMIYPRSRHAVTDRFLNYHLRRTMTEFVVRHLKP